MNEINYGDAGSSLISDVIGVLCELTGFAWGHTSAGKIKYIASDHSPVKIKLRKTKKGPRNLNFDITLDNAYPRHYPTHLDWKNAVKAELAFKLREYHKVSWDPAGEHAAFILEATEQNSKYNLQNIKYIDAYNT